MWAPPFPDIPYKRGMLGLGYAHQREAFRGSWRAGKWKADANGAQLEEKDITVEPGETFRIWIGLNPCVPPDAMQALHNSSRLGKLILPLAINNQPYEWSHDV